MTLFGLDLLGIADSDWHVKDTLRVFPKGWVLGLFDGKETFGDAGPIMEQFLATDKPSAIRVHASWDNHRLTAPDILKRRCQKYEKIAKQTKTPIYVSPSCEYSSTSRGDVEHQVYMVRTYAPSCIPVLSPMGGYIVPKTIVEEHGVKATTNGAQAASTDGQALFDIDSVTWIKRNTGLYTLGWGYRFNLSESGPKVLPPFRRTAAPSNDYITGVIRLFDPLEPAPKPEFPVTPIKDPLLYKNFSEDSPGSNSRDNLPLLILKVDFKAVDIVTYKGDPIGKFIKFGTYPGRRFRYYSGLPGGMNKWGWQIADMARAKSGSPYVAAKVGQTYFGLFDPTRRVGFYHD